MQTKTNGFIANKASPDTGTKSLVQHASPKRLLSTWIWRSDPSKRSGMRLVLRWLTDSGANDRTLEELRLMSNHQLADIGLSRSDLTLEGLAIAGAKRARRQSSTSSEVVNLGVKQEVNGHGD